MNKLLNHIDQKYNAKGNDNWRVIQGDCLEILPQLPDKSVDLIFADPPYNLQLKKELYRPNMTRVNGVTDSWDKFASFDEYDDFCKQWLLQSRRILKDNGAIWVIGTYHCIYRIGALMQYQGFYILNDVIWRKSNPMPNFQGKRFTNATETLIWAKKNEKSRAVFNNKVMKNQHDNPGKQMTNVWPIPVCNGGERLRDSSGNKLHPTQKPEKLIENVLLASTKKGDVVLDPFLGSGTTLSVARKLGRIGVGIERLKKYVSLAHKRVLEIKENTDIPEEPASIDRVSVKELVDTGLLKKGRTIYFQRGKQSARILQSGKIKLNEKPEIGSIHKIGALLANSTECNGWMHWYIKEKGEYICIDEIRTKYRNSRKGQ